MVYRSLFHILQCRKVARLNEFNSFEYLRGRQIPPSQFEQCGNFFVGKALAYWSGGNSADYGIWRHVLCDYCTRADYCSVAYGDACQNDAFKTRPYVGFRARCRPCCPRPCLPICRAPIRRKISERGRWRANALCGSRC